MRGYYGLRKMQKRIFRRRRLGCKNIQRITGHFATAHRLRQRLLIYNASTCGIDEVDAILHSRELRRANKSTRAFIKRGMHGDEIAACYKLVQSYRLNAHLACDRFRDEGVVGDKLYTEPFEALGYRTADAP